MHQEVGETRDAILEDVNKRVEDILNANKNRKDTYWIVIFATPAKGTYQGKPTLMNHVKPYPIKPKSMVGMIIGQVDNSKGGDIDWEVNMHQKPFDYSKVQGAEEIPEGEVVFETTTIPNAYLTK